MDIVNTYALESNKQIKINFAGGDLSSDAGLLLIKEFAAKIGFAKLINRLFKTNDKAVRLHRDSENLMQMIYRIIAAYFEDDCAGELKKDPVFTSIPGKDSLASQPTLSRFFNRMDETTLAQFDAIDRRMRDVVYSIKRPEQMLLDLDSTLLNTYENQEGQAFNFHYQDHGYHPLLCFDGLTGDLLKTELRDGTMYCSKDAEKFMEPLLQEFIERGIPTYLRGDSGFASPKLYETCEKNGCSYAIGLKENPKLRTLIEVEDEALYRTTKMDLEPYQLIRFYCGRGKMENFIKEGKSGFDFAAVSSHSKIVNANRLRLHMLAYNLFNWFRCLASSASMRKQRIDTIRLKLLKIAARAIRSARYITFKLCSSCPYKQEFFETLDNIRQLDIQLE